MASHFFLVFLLVVSTVVGGTIAADAEKPQPADNKSSPPAGNSAKSLIDSLGPSQDYSDYEIPKELAPEGVEVVDDYVPISPNGSIDSSNPLAQPEDDMNVKTLPSSSSASRASSTALAVAVAAAGGASFFFF